MKNIFSQSLEIDGRVGQDVFDESVGIDVNITSMTSHKPVKVNSYSHSSYSMTSSLSFIPLPLKYLVKIFRFEGCKTKM